MTWSIYLLWNPLTNRTYIGSTTDPARRLRQHNREITGGARSTHTGAPNWTMLMFLSGFPDRSSACRWEKLAKSRARGRQARSHAFLQILAGQCPPGRSNSKYIPPKGLTIEYPTNQEAPVLHSA